MGNHRDGLEWVVHSDKQTDLTDGTKISKSTDIASPSRTIRPSSTLVPAIRITWIVQSILYDAFLLIYITPDRFLEIFLHGAPMQVTDISYLFLSKFAVSQCIGAARDHNNIRSDIRTLPKVSCNASQMFGFSRSDMLSQDLFDAHLGRVGRGCIKMFQLWMLFATATDSIHIVQW
jgi:hypothetical protein